MPHADAAWLRMDQPTNLMVITGVVWFEETPDWDRVREVIGERLVTPFPRFRQRVAGGALPGTGPHWEDDPDFDLGLHVHRVSLPPPGDEDALRALVGDLAATPLDPAKPLWQFHLVDGYGEGGAMVARIHHCIADGIALARVLLSLTDAEPDSAGSMPAAPPAQHDHGLLDAIVAPARGLLSAAAVVAGAVAHESAEIARDPGHLRDLAATARTDAAALARVLLEASDPDSALKGRLGRAKSVSWSNPIALDDVKAVGHGTGTTVNDVVVTAVAGALRSYLRRHGGLVDELTAFVPFNLRPLDEPLPAELGNRFGLVFLRLPVGIGDRRRRLNEVHARMRRIKESAEGAVSYGVLDALGRTPPPVEKRLVDLFSTKGSAVVTNVPGPGKTVYLAGTPVTGILVWAPASGGVSMTVSIFSYAGRIVVGFMTDAGLIPDPEAIVGAFETEIEGLLRLKARRLHADRGAKP